MKNWTGRMILLPCLSRLSCSMFMYKWQHSFPSASSTLVLPPVWWSYRTTLIPNKYFKFIYAFLPVQLRRHHLLCSTFVTFILQQIKSRVFSFTFLFSWNSYRGICFCTLYVLDCLPYWLNHKKASCHVIFYFKRVFRRNSSCINWF